MAKQEIIYKDGRGVILTPSALSVGRVRYRLMGIQNHGMAVIRPLRLAGVFISWIGIGFLLFGFQWWMVDPIASERVVNRLPLSIEVLFMGCGALIVLLGLIITMILRERYAVRLVTERGDLHVVVSTKKKYIIQIVHALSRAFRLGHRNSHLARTVYL